LIVIKIIVTKNDTVFENVRSFFEAHREKIELKQEHFSVVKKVKSIGFAKFDYFDSFSFFNSSL
jgi:hypothetical protein